MVLAGHGITAAIEFAFYLLLLIPTALNVWHWGIRQHTGWIFMTLYALRKSKTPTAVTPTPTQPLPTNTTQ